MYEVMGMDACLSGNSRIKGHREIQARYSTSCEMKKIIIEGDNMLRKGGVYTEIIY